MKNEFTWSDDLIREFIAFGRRQMHISDQDYLGMDIKAFKESKQPKKDWEIEAFYYQTDKRNMATKTSNGMFWTGGDMATKQEMLSSVWLIHSVKRLSDNEVFSIGDNTQFGKILHFRISEDFIHVIFDGESSWQFLSVVQKVKEPIPLFTDFNGVKMTDRLQPVFAIRKGTFELYSHHSGEGLGVWLNGWYTTKWLPNPKEKDDRIIELINEHYFIFSTKEAAEEYILMNKLVLSLNDLLSVWGDETATANYYKSAPLFKKFEQLAKSKI